MSRVGLKPISLPEKVAVKMDGRTVVVEGPKGKLDFTLPEGISLKTEANNVILCRANEQRQIRALHGTARSLVQNMILGVSKGFSKDLEIHGVGLRAAVKGKDLDLSLGRSHPLLHPIPAGLTVTVNENTKIKVEGIDKPYKGKGVRYSDEHVRRKEGKSVGK
jgi:large subunit ribosomal protein L6